MSNLERLRTALRKMGIGSVILNEIGNVQWASGFTGSSAWIILQDGHGAFITDSRYTIQATEEVRELPVVTYANPTTSTEFLTEQVRMLGIGRLAFESEFVTLATYEDWRIAFAPCEICGVKGLIAPLRMVKTADELAAISEACKLADACFDHILRMIQPGVKEFDIGLDIEFFFRRHGAEIAFAPAVVSGERSARPHGKPSEKRLADGDFVTMDFGAKVRGLCSDITRTVVVGSASPRHREVYNQVLHAQEASIAIMKPGVKARDVDQRAREVLDEKGLSRFFGHGLGHGLGRAVHDFGRMSPSSDDVLEEGQVWTVEPGVYIEGFGGVRIEDDVVIGPNGAELLTHSPKHLMELSPAGV